MGHILGSSHRQLATAHQEASPGEVQVGEQEEFLHGKGSSAFKRAAQGNGGVTILGSVQETTGQDNLCHDLFDKVVIDQRLDLTILEVFSNLNDSVIPHTGV